ncbi:MAG: peptide-methionine (S)-S-oxide reductase MsrA [Thermoleophilia bacterium]|nr:peptide-methionine (S)-S-oxide reductase MsrA [Thermoleophilia bacterium]
MPKRTQLAAFTAALALALSWAGVGLAQDRDGEPKKPADAPKAETPKADPAEKPEAAKDKPKIEVATFGGGCFWCTEAVFERVKGVKSVVSGYAGGTVPNPTYEMVCSGLTGHAEVIQVEFDPSLVTYERILQIFFASHDPTTLNAQGPDFGTQYRSIIFHHSDAQRETALKVYRDLTRRKAFRAPIVTELQPFQAFYAAEPYHQDYFRNHPNEPYSQTWIVPKLRKLAGKK